MRFKKAIARVTTGVLGAVVALIIIAELALDGRRNEAFVFHMGYSLVGIAPWVHDRLPLKSSSRVEALFEGGACVPIITDRYAWFVWIHPGEEPRNP